MTGVNIEKKKIKSQYLNYRKWIEIINIKNVSKIKCISHLNQILPQEKKKKILPQKNKKIYSPSEKDFTKQKMFLKNKSSAEWKSY